MEIEVTIVIGRSCIYNGRACTLHTPPLIYHYVLVVAVYVQKNYAVNGGERTHARLILSSITTESPVNVVLTARAVQFYQHATECGIVCACQMSRDSNVAVIARANCHTIRMWY